MKIEQLRQALQVAKYGNISKTAKEMFLSQPNLSIAIKNLEDELGYPIFMRTNQGVKLTALGEKFISSAEIVLTQFDMLSDINRSKSGESSDFRLNIGIAPYKYLIKVVCDIYKKHISNRTHFSVFNGSRQEIINSVCDRRCDIGIIGIYSPYFDLVMRQLEESGLFFMQLGELPITVLVGKNNPLYAIDRDYVTREDLIGMPFVSLDEMEYGTTSSLFDLLGIGGDDCSHSFYCSSWSSITDLLSYTGSFTIAATNRTAYDMIPYYEDIRALNLHGTDITNKVGWIGRQNEPTPPQALEFISMLQKYY